MNIKTLTVALLLAVVLCGCGQRFSSKPLDDTEIATIMLKCKEMGMESFFSTTSYSGRAQIDRVGCHHAPLDVRQ